MLWTILWFLNGSMLKNLPAKQEMWIWPLSQEDLLEKEMATHFSILAWVIPWTEETGGLENMGLPNSQTEHTLTWTTLYLTI